MKRFCHVLQPDENIKIVAIAVGDCTELERHQNRAGGKKYAIAMQ